jgi:hypothetical protein
MINDTKRKDSCKCLLCGEYSEHGVTNELTQQPYDPQSVRESAYVCCGCRDALESADADADSCLWCGEDIGQFEGGDVYYMRIDNMVRAPLGEMCFSCFSIAQGAHPPDFSDSLKEKVRERDGYECVKCGMPQEHHRKQFGQALHIHHKDSNKRNNEMDNLVTLCARCHGEV